MTKMLMLCLIVTVNLQLFSASLFAKKNGSRGPTAVIVTTVVSDELSDQIEALGTTKAKESVTITADRSEKIVAIYFDDGQAVKKGALLVTLDKGQEEAELRASKAITQESLNAYNRAEGLSGTSALPKATLQERAAQLSQAKAVTESLKANLTSFNITAPFDGMLGFRQVSVGTLVQPGDEITTIDDLSQIKVDFEVPSLFLPTLKSGLAIRGFVDAFPNRYFDGFVTSVNPRIDPVTRTVIVRALIPNNDGVLKPGLLMAIDLYKNSREAILIPEESLIKRSENNFVYIIKEDQGKMFAQKKNILLGIRKPGVIEVISGLDVGDKIIVHGVSKVQDGAQVTILAEKFGDQSLEELLNQQETSTEQ